MAISKLPTASVLTDAWGMWRRDGDLLARIAGPFLFLPLFALYLVVPAIPLLKVEADMGEAEQLAQAKIYVDWVAVNGHWYVLATLLMHFGMLVILALYLDSEKPVLRMAFARAARLFPRYLLAMILVGIPTGIGLWVILLLLPGLYILGRMIVLGPLLVAERPIGVVAAIRRSWAMTRGNGLIVAGFASVNLLGGLAAAPLLAIDRMLRANSEASQIAIAMADAGAAFVSALSLLAMVLLQIAVYRRLLSSRGT